MADVDITLNTGTSKTIRFESTGLGLGNMYEITLTPDTSTVSTHAIEGLAQANFFIGILFSITNSGDLFAIAPVVQDLIFQRIRIVHH